MTLREYRNVRGAKPQRYACDACKRPIQWMRTRAGKAMAVDEEPAVVTIVTKDGRVERGRIPHWVTCTSPDAFRKRDKAGPEPTNETLFDVDALEQMPDDGGEDE